MKYFFLLSLICLAGISSYAQIKVSIVVKDENTGESLPAASVQYGEGKGVVTDLDGKATLNLAAGKYSITASYVGLEPLTKEVIVGSVAQTVEFMLKASESSTFSEVKIFSDIAVGRRTPVAFSDVSSIKIREELGTRDLPLVLNTTPGVYATSAGGGDGDARINVRGFNQRYVAVMVDGIPMNDMENGWVYWSNWFGLDVVTQKIQVQRGLGASKLSVPSVGGTINILSQGIEQKQKITISSEFGNNLNLRETIGYNSGRLKGGWGITSAISLRKNNGWVENLRSRQMFYFLKVQKEFSNQSLSLSIMGSPQEHYQRPLRMPIAFYDKEYAAKVGVDLSKPVQGDYAFGTANDFGVNHNQHWGYLTRNRRGESNEREILSERMNYYHKPILNLKHFISFGERLSLSTILYASFGNGGGTRLQTAKFNNQGQVDFDKIYYDNTHAPSIFVPVYDLSFVNDTSQYKSRNYIFAQENNHFWAGTLSTLKFQVNKRIDISAGFDGRYYHTDRFQVMHDLLGGDYAVPNTAGDDKNNPQNKVIRKGDIFGYKIRTYVKQAGLYFLAEYHKDKLSAFINLTGTVNTYNRTNYFELKTAEGNFPTSGWQTFHGGTIKGGASYNINEYNSIFVNAGILSRAQMVNTVLVGRTLNRYENIENELIIAQELGYAFNKGIWHFALNAYNTEWRNKPVVQSIPFGTEIYFANVPGMNALHQGVELEGDVKVNSKITAEIALSESNWRWTSNARAIVTDELGNEVTRVEFSAKNVKVGDAAQRAASAGIRYEPIKGLWFKPRITYFDNYYADFDPESLQGDNANRQSWKIPSYYQLDINLGYNLALGQKKYSLGFRVNLMNVTNVVFISDARNNDYGNTFDAQAAGVYMGMGFRWNTGVTFSF